MTELYEDFSQVPNGAPASTIATGQSCTNFSFYPAAAPEIRNGFLTTLDPNNAAAGSYRIALLDRDVVHVGAQFAFTPWSAIGGVMCLSIQDESIADIPSGVPVSPMHLQITPVSWSLDVNAECGSEIETIVSGTWSIPLAADGSTLHRADVHLDRAASRCNLFLPDGTSVTFTDARFALPGKYVYAEPFKSPSANLSTTTNALIREWWADSSKSYLPVLRSVVPSAWTTASLDSNWQHHPNNQPVQYRRTGDTVEIRGVAAGTLSPSIIFVLPSALHPKQNLHFPSTASGAYGDILVTKYGEVMLAIGNPSWVTMQLSYSLT